MSNLFANTFIYSHTNVCRVVEVINRVFQFFNDKFSAFLEKITLLDLARETDKTMNTLGHF